MADLIERAQSVADQVLFRAAKDVDRGLHRPDDGLRALADAGLFGIAGPEPSGGADLVNVALRLPVQTDALEAHLTEVVPAARAL